MEKIEVINFNIVGEDSQENFLCNFKVKTRLERGDLFLADQRRRELLGQNPNDALPQRQLDAFMLGELAVRIVDPPDWWKAVDYGVKIEDNNVIVAIYNAAVAKEKERKEALKKKAAEALKDLAKNQPKADAEPKK